MVPTYLYSLRNVKLHFELPICLMEADLLLFWARGRELSSSFTAAKLLIAGVAVATMAPGIWKGQDLLI